MLALIDDRTILMPYQQEGFLVKMMLKEKRKFNYVVLGLVAAVIVLAVYYFK
jgi:hypothetical protein